MLNFNNILPIIIGYFLGSIPSAYIIAKNRGVDIRKKVKNGQFGSAKTAKELGKFPGVLVGAMDFCKGALSIMIADRVSGQEWIMVLTGVAAIIGHNWSIFLHFLGGKGSATTFGNLFYLLPEQFLLAGVVTAIPTCFLRKKSRVTLPGKKRNFRTSSFLTGILFLFTFFLALIFGESYVISFSPIIFSLPIMMKKN